MVNIFGKTMTYAISGGGPFPCAQGASKNSVSVVNLCILCEFICFMYAFMCLLFESMRFMCFHMSFMCFHMRFI